MSRRHRETGGLGGLHTVDSTARARLEREAFNTGLLAVLISWMPFATIFTLVAGATRWAEARRAYGAHSGAFATIYSAVAILVWLVLLAG